MSCGIWSSSVAAPFPYQDLLRPGCGAWFLVELLHVILLNLVALSPKQHWNSNKHVHLGDSCYKCKLQLFKTNTAWSTIQGSSLSDFFDPILYTVSLCSLGCTNHWRHLFRFFWFFCVLRWAFLPEPVIPFVLGKLFPISGMSRHRKPPNISKRLKEAEFRHVVGLSQCHHPFRGSDSSLLASTVRRILKVIKRVFVYEYPQKTTAQNGIGLDRSGCSG